MRQQPYQTLNYRPASLLRHMSPATKCTCIQSESINQPIQRELGSCETLDTQVPESPISLQVYVSRPGHSPSCPLLSTAESSTSPPHLKALGLRSDRISISISGDGVRARLDSTRLIRIIMQAIASSGLLVPSPPVPHLPSHPSA